ncbi:hypothetical protein KY290_036869 [Solanum tuberosum]|uniref:Uncharacterized protein n=1 Tax=Solanum tuberosum TaxID=4113 RepID=A0ABQ7TV89_SOLTU|nr:hypothetical protein KY289_036338 [Solanum tuberosum]KAH0639606.1 hypothetical protein KY285_036192 [Solanum tuberosum]KAH0738164.1 hypothetical protein KY290_036869 [Solanum tuberosum]
MIGGSGRDIYDDEAPSGEAEEVLEDYETQVGEATVVDAHVETRPVIREDMVFIVEYYCLDLNLPPPEEDDEDSH